MQMEGRNEEVFTSKEFETFKETLKQANKAWMEVKESKPKREHYLVERNYSLRKCADEVEAVRVIFNDDSEERTIFKKAMKLRSLRASMNEEKELIIIEEKCWERFSRRRRSPIQ